MVCEDLLRRFVEAARETLGTDLAGVYLHGSAALGCFQPGRSDLDLILVVEESVPMERKLAFLERAAALDAEAPGKGLELSIVRRAVCRPFVYPTPFELHFSAAHRQAYHADPAGFVERMQGVDRDLAAHFTVINACGVALYGEAVTDVFGPVSRQDYLDSILRDVEDASQEILRDPVYYTLNLCRVLAQAEAGLVLSKQDGGAWALERLPAYRPVIQAALDGYGTGTPVALPADDLLNFAESIQSEIKKFRLRPPRS